MGVLSTDAEESPAEQRLRRRRFELVVLFAAREKYEITAASQRENQRAASGCCARQTWHRLSAELPCHTSIGIERLRKLYSLHPCRLQSLKTFMNSTSFHLSHVSDLQSSPQELDFRHQKYTTAAPSTSLPLPPPSRPKEYSQHLLFVTHSLFGFFDTWIVRLFGHAAQSM